jgi:hypothetical protein
MLRMTMLLVLAACTPLPPPPPTLGQILDMVAESGAPRLPGDPDAETEVDTTPLVLRAELAPSSPVLAEPIYEVTVFPDGPVSTFTVMPPPQVTVHLLPRRDDVLQSDVLTIWLTTGGQEGVHERDAWLVFSATVLAEPVNWGTEGEPVLQVIPFDTVLPFRAFEITDYGPRFHRQPTSGIVQIHGSVRLPAPIYLQMVIEAPEENELGYIVTHAYGLIPGG